MHTTKKYVNKIKLSLLPLISFAGILTVLLIHASPVVDATCSPPATSYGTDTLSLNVPSTTTYYVWVEMETPNASDNSVQLSVGSDCFNVGGSSSMPTNQLTWINYQNGSASQLMSVPLTQGSNTLTFTGTEPGVGIDNVELLANPQCTPSGEGNNCTSAQPTPSEPTNLTAAVNSATSVTLNWGASSDSQGLQVSGYYVFKNSTSGNPIATLGTSTNTYTDTTDSAGGKYTYYVEAYDNAAKYVGGTTDESPAASVTVQTSSNPPSTPFVTPTPLNAVSVNLSWPAVSDSGGPGLSTYKVYQGVFPNGTYLGQDLFNSSTSTYNYTASPANATELTPYSFYVIAYDTNNTPSNPGTATATTLIYPQPNAPTSLTDSNTATTATINWTEASDPYPGPGIAGYDIYVNGALTKGITPATTTTFQDTGLTPSTKYTFCVSEYDSAVNPDSSPQSCETLTTSAYAAPSVPTNLSSSNVSQTSATISWTASSDTGGPGIAGYIITRTGGQKGTFTKTLTGTGTSYSDTGLAPATAYSYTVQAYDSASPVNYSPISSALPVTTSSYTSPNPPTNLSSSNITSTSATVSWSEPSVPSGGLPISGYYVEVNGSTVAQLPSASDVSYTDSALSPSQTYTFGIVTYDSQTDPSVPADISVTTQGIVQLQPPTAPTNLTANAVSTSQINLSWGASTDSQGTVTSYRIYRGTRVSSLSQISSVSASTTTFGDSDLSSGTTYYYYVVAVNNGSQVSVASNTASAITQNITSQTGTVNGTVTNSSTQATLAGVNIVTGSLATSQGAESTTTNSSGYYVITGFKTNGTHYIYFSAKGFYDNSASVYMGTAKTITKNVTLSPIK